MTSSLKSFSFKTARRQSRRAAFAAPFIDLLFLAGMTYLLSDAKLVYAQGMALDLELPRASQALISGRNVGSVLSIKPEGQLFLEGRKLSLESLPQALKALRASGFTHGALLIRADAKVKFETFVAVCDIARSNGFLHTQLALEDRDAP